MSRLKIGKSRMGEPRALLAGRGMKSMGMLSYRHFFILIGLLLSMFDLIPVSRAQDAVWKELQNGVVALQNSGRTTEAINAATEALNIAEATFGGEDHHVAVSLNALAWLYDSETKYAEAEPLYNRALAIDEKVLGPESPVVADELNNLANHYFQQGKYVEAEPLYNRALAIGKKAVGPDHPGVAWSLVLLANLYTQQGKYAEAEPLYNRALAINEKALGPDNPAVAMSLTNFANFYVQQDKYIEAEPLYKRALAIDEKALGPGNPAVAGALHDLARLRMYQGKYAEAEPLYKRALAIDEKALGPDHPDLAAILNGLATLYLDQYKRLEAEPFFTRALAIDQKALGPDNPRVALILDNLANAYYQQGKYTEAEPLYKRAVSIDEKVLGPDHPNLATDLCNLANLYVEQGKYAEAEPLYKRALAVNEKALGPDHPVVAMMMANLAILYNSQARYAVAEALLKRALAIVKKAEGPDHPDTTKLLGILATTYYGDSSFVEAAAFFDQTLQNLSKEFRYSFTYMSEKDRLQFLKNVENFFSTYFSFCVSYAKHDPALVGKMYDFLLWEKGMVGISVRTLRGQIAASADTEAIKMFDDLAAKRSQSSRLATSRPVGWEQTKRHVDNEANDVEGELARRFSWVSERLNSVHATWRNVQKKLSPGEAAVEFVRFDFQDGAHWTGKSQYVGLIVTPRTLDEPILVRLGEGAKLEGEPLEDYKRFIEARSAEVLQGASVIPGQAFYIAFWKPVESSLEGAETVYVSPDGVLDQISLGILPDKDGKPIISKYDLRIVSSTSVLLESPHVYTANTAVLAGNASYDLTNERYQEALLSLNTPGQASPPPMGAIPEYSTQSANGMRSQEAPTGLLVPLPGTAIELSKVENLLKKQNWQVVVYERDRALVEAVRGVHHPRVLYLATHGFFESDQAIPHNGSATNQRPSSEFEEPMLRSGLYFAGADHGREGKLIPEGLGDGVLTAYEASTLDLHGTEMVVLSACETGLGKVEAGEGVFGLLRGFEEAGADSVVISMWKVPDTHTQQLMTAFYENWLVKHMEKHQALRQAQIALRSRITDHFGADLPYYWGAFVLVGR